MPWLTWLYALCKVGEQGSLSGLAVVRTVVSIRLLAASVATHRFCSLVMP